MLLAALLGMGSSTAWAETVTYTISSKNTLSTTGTAPAGSTASIVETFGTSKQMTNGNSQTLTLTGYNGYQVTNVTLSMKSNKSGGAGKLSYSTNGGSTYTYIVGSSGSGVDFNNSKWHGAYSTSYTDISKDVVISPTASNFIIKIEATANSLYCESYTITYSQTKTPTTLTLNKAATTLTAKGDTETLTATVTPDGGAALVSPSITWTSSDETVATVAAGVVTPLKEGSTTITASYAGDATYDESSNTCAVTVTDARTAVNLSTFTATNTTLIVGGSPSFTATSVTNDQVDWTAAYTYGSSNTSVATVNESGVITAVAKGNATITCSLNVNPSDDIYKAGTTTSKTVDITVNNPSHTATFSVNGDALLSSSNTFEEGATITFPSDPDDIDGKVFKGWVAKPIAGTQVAAPSFVSSPEMGNSDVTYYAVFAEIVPGDEVTDTKTITTSTANIPTGYGSANTFTEYSLEGIKFKIQQMYLNGAKLQWRTAGHENGTGTMYNTDPLGKIQNIVLTYDSGDSNKNFTVKVGDSENPSSGTSITPTNVGSVYTFDCSSYNKSYFVLTNGSSAGYLSSIAITYKTGTPDTYTNYCTTVSDLPLAVVTLSTESITMTWGESGKTLTASATVNDEPLDETITFTPSSANLTIDGSGNISCDEPGSYTITATVAATGEHQAGQAVCNVTVNKKDITLAFAKKEVTKMDEDLEYTQEATVTPAAYGGEISYAITSSTSADAEIDDETGELTFINTGAIVVTATGAATDYYNGNTASYTLYVKTTPTLSASDQSIAYGETYTLDTSSFHSGDITLVPTSTTIATVDGLTLTSQAVGSTLVTVNTAANDTYVEGSTTFTLTITAPEAASTNTAENTIFYESFNSISGTGGRDDVFNGNVGTASLSSSDESWPTTTRCGGASKCLKFGTTNDNATLSSSTISISGNATLTFAGAGWESGTMSLTVSATGATLTGNTDVTLTASTWKTYTVNITGATGSVTLSFAGRRGFLDDIKITQAITSTTVTTTGGYATYCYQYPLDLNGISGAKAYKVSSLDKSKEKVMLTQITGTIKGGVPFILKSDADTDDIEIPLADESTNVPDGNLLVGTLAPTFVEQTSGDYTNFAYSKSKGYFVKLGDAGNTVPANRAYLPINLGSGSPVKALSFDFGDATAIDGLTNGQQPMANGPIFNLAGQRVDGSRFKVNGSGLKTGIYIVNGKKVLVK